MDVQDDASQRVLGVAVVKARRPRDGVVADELVVRIPEGREGRRGALGKKNKQTKTQTATDGWEGD